MNIKSIDNWRRVIYLYSLLMGRKIVDRVRDG